VMDLFGNKPWLIMLLLTTLVFVSLALKGGMYIYYFENYVSKTALAGFLSHFGVIHLTDIPAYGFSIFNAGGILFMIVGIMFSKKMADTYGKRDVFKISLLLATFFVAVFYLYPPDAILLIFVSQILHGFFYGITIPLLWAMIADVADYSEWKNNRRATAIIFSAMLVGLKLGITFGGSLVTVCLDLYSYDALVDNQSETTVQGIKMAMSIYASIPFLAGIGLLFLYEIDKAMEDRIENELNKRRLENKES
ncbi:MAG: MFS transporter, partial [Bacteroidota bacterium]